MRFECVSRTHVGLKRKINEDSVFVDSERGLWAVADGMGGHEAGEVASAAVVDALGRLEAASDVDRAAEEAIEALKQVNGDLIRLAHAKESERTIGTTVVGLASHPYFALAEDVTDHRLRVAATSYLPTDVTGVPTGIAPVAGSPFDLREARPVDPAFDHCWVLDGTGFREVAELTGGGIRVTLGTDQPGLQVYAGGGEVPGVALEPQGLPDAVHHPEWPSVELHPGVEYSWCSVLTLGTA